MFKNLKKLVLPVVFVVGLVSGYFVAQQLPRKYSPAINWVVANPAYAEYLYKAHENHITAAEAVLTEELVNLSGKKE